MSIIHLKDINKTYQGAQPLHVLKGINLDIEKVQIAAKKVAKFKAGAELDAAL